MRWLVGHPGPHFSVQDVYTGWVEALRGLGEDVYTFNLGDRISFYDAAHIEAAETTEANGLKAFSKAMDRRTAIGTASHEILRAAFLCWPDAVLLISAFFMPTYLLDAMRGRGMKVILIHTESPYQDDEQLERAAHADMNLLNDPVNLQAYGEHGPAVYMPHAYRPGVHYPAPGGDRLYDLAFVGTGFPSRVEFFGSMDLDGLNVHLAGPWLDLPADSPLRDWTATEQDNCLDNEEAAGIYRQARCGINFYRREAEDAHTGEGWAVGPREIEMAACGLWFARDPRPESDGLFPMLPAYSTPGEASELIRWAVKHPEQREKAAAAARVAVAGRTFESNAKALMGMIEKG